MSNGDNPNPVFRITPDLRVSDVNEAAKAAFGITGDKLPDGLSVLCNACETQTVEIASGEAHYVCRFVPDAEGGMVYALDVTSLQPTNRLPKTRRYQALFENNNDAIFVFSLDYHIIEANQRAADLLGYETPDELIGLPAGKHTDEVSEIEIQDVGSRLFAGETVPIYERRLRRRDSAVLDVEINVSLVRDAQGQPQQIQSIIRDITQRKRLADELRQQDTRLRAVISTSPIIVWSCDAEGRITLMEGSGLNKIKESAGNIGQSVWELYAPFPDAIDAIQRTLRGEEINRIIHTGAFTFNCHYFPVFEGQEVIGLLGTAFDITEIMRTKDELTRQQAHTEKAREFLEAVLRNSNEGIFVTALDGCIQQTNPAFDRIFGFAVDEAFNRRLKSLTHPHNQGEVDAALQRAIQHHATSELEVQMIRNNAMPFMATLYIAPIVTKNRTIGGLVCTVRDITNQKEIQKSLAQSRDAAVETARLKSEFLATMSHEIRTPLNAVIGITELLRDTALDGEQQEYAEIIYSEANTLLSLISAILDYSKLEAGRMILDSHHYDLRKLVKGVVDSLNVTAQKKGVSLKTHIDSEIPAAFRGDSLRLRQIIVNLLSNAVKFTHEGEVALSVLCMHNDAETMTLRFIVTDTGIGIPTDMISELFQPFVQADGSNRRRYGGTGLGLAIVRGIIDLMDSHLEVESKPGEGSQFAFEITQLIAEVRRPRRKKRHIRKERAVSPDAPVVLIVEDNTINGDLTQRQLQKMGFRTQLAHDGLEAIHHINNNREGFAAILMDCQMPVMNGFDATRQIRARDVKTPIIAMTANALAKERAKCIEAGMDDYITKPVNVDLLRRKLLEWTT